MIQQEDRAVARALLGVNLVVEAGAGTGKTTLLIDRLCLAILVQQVPVEKIVALTFTEKAAAEIKKRLAGMLRHLIAAASNPQIAAADLEDKEHKNPLFKLMVEQFGLLEKDTLAAASYSPKEKTEVFTYQKLVERASAALDALDRASLGTIHGFCGEILKTYPLEAGISPNAKIDDGQGAENLFDEQWNLFLDEELGDEAPRANLWKKVLPNIPLPNLKKFAQNLYQGEVDFSHYHFFSHSDLIAQVCLKKAEQAEQLSTEYLPAGGKPRAIEKTLIQIAQYLRRSALFLQGKEIEPLAESPTYTVGNSGIKGWTDEAFEEAKGLSTFASEVEPEKLQLYIDAYTLVKDFVERARETCTREGLLGFGDLLVKMRNLVRDNVSVRQALKKKYSVLFIDEFQDTDPVQGEMLLFLAEEASSAAPTWQQVRLAPGKLFVVGDPKQSIYRFRGADITAYEQFTDLILQQGGKKCFLRHNHRSMGDIVLAVNAILSRSMEAEKNFQPAYEPIFTDRPIGIQAVEWLYVEHPESADGTTGKAKAEEFRENQVERIADWITQQVGKLTLANGEKLAYKDITVLLRSLKNRSSNYAKTFFRRGIPFTIETNKDFGEKPEVKDFLTFLQAVDDPLNRTALAGVLRSPLGGMTDEEIFQVASKGELSLLVKPSDPKAAACYQLIDKFARLAGRLPLKDFMETVLEKTFLPEACAAAYDGEQTLANLQRLVRLADGYSADAPVSLSQFLLEISTSLKEKKDLPGAHISSDTQDAVSVMTIHKSKGLESPVIILADMSQTKKEPKESNWGYSWQHNMYGFSVGKYCDANWAFLEDERKKHERCESIRLLYVALTRAREKLILVGDNRKNALKEAKPFLLAGLWPAEQEVLEQGDLYIPVHKVEYVNPKTFAYQHKVREEGTQKEIDFDAWRVAYDKQQSTYKEMLDKDKKLAPSELVQSRELLSPEQRAGAELGTVCHRALEMLMRGKETTAQAAAQRAAAQVGTPTRADEASTVLTAFEESPLFAQLRACKLLASEMPFSFLTAEGQVESGVMDAVFETPDQSIWVVDYKTDKLKPGQEKALLAKKYQLQLGIYQQAAEKLFAPKKVRCSAVFLRTFAAADL